MKKYGLWVLFSVVCFGIIGLSRYNAYSYPSGGYGAGYYAAVLRDAEGNPVKVGSNTPYSPKQTCGLAGVNGTNCHIDMVQSLGLVSGNNYESGTGYADKDGSGSGPYSVPYPLHGVSAGFHFQQGRDLPWSDLQRGFYGLPGFTSSPGMYGTFDPSTNRRLAGLHEFLPGAFDLSSYEFTNSACGWCHPGGGPMEYDREGFRYDGSAGLFQSGANPDPKQGDYFSFDPASGAIVSRVSAWQSGGVAEIDCLMCHLSTTVNTTKPTQAECTAAGGSWLYDMWSYSYYCSLPMRYSQIERNFAFSEEESPGLAASLGLSGTNSLNSLLNIGRKGGEGINPEIGQTGWSWSGNFAVNTDEIYFDPFLAAVPPKENCAQCHFADKSLMSKGPSGLPLGYTVFQKVLPVGTVDDGDEIAGVNGLDGKNDTDWTISKGRTESYKQGQSINDPLNPDTHMDTDKGNMTCSKCHYLLGTPRDYAADCTTCHPDYYGTYNIVPVAPQLFPALTDAQGNVIQPAREVFRIDHQFAKGNSKPDLRVMDQLDNTVTCESCHITRTHPNAGSAPDPTVAHSGFPAFHFSVIGCKSCHIPLLNGPSKELLADYTTGPYRKGERMQTNDNASGINYRPLHMWDARNHDGSDVKIRPFAAVTTAAWTDLKSDGTLEPVPQWVVKNAAEALRNRYGSTGGVFNWPLNKAQNGDISLIVNKQGEITDMINQLRILGVREPVMKIYISAYSVSHNVAPGSSGLILGSPAGGGCLMCHASTDPLSPRYSPAATGFFSKEHLLFSQPVDGGSGLVQTSVPMSGSSTPLRRINEVFSGIKADGTPLAIDLSRNDGETIGNSLSQNELLGFSTSYTAHLTDPATVGIERPSAAISYSVSNLNVNFSAAQSTCPSGTVCGYNWSFGDGTSGTGSGVSHLYPAAGDYTVTLVVSNGLVQDIRSVLLTVTAANLAPTAAMTISQDGWTVTVVDGSSDDAPLPADAVFIDWGNGTTSSGNAGATFSRTYTTAGTYIIKHWVTDSGGLKTSSPNQTIAVPVKYVISGRVTRGSTGAALSGVLMYLKQGSTNLKIVVSDSAGNYSFTGLNPGTYIVHPSKSGFTFGPDRTVTVGPDATGIDFVSTP